MKQLINIFSWLIIAICILSALTLLILIAIPVIIFLISTFLLVKYFIRQTNRYRLTIKTYGFLIIAGIVSILISAMIAKVYGYSLIVSTPITILLFLASGNLLLFFWAYTKKKGYLSNLKRIRAEKEHLEREKNSMKNKIEKLDKRIVIWERDSEGNVEEQRKIKEKIKVECLRGDRTAISKKNKIEEEIKKLSLDEIKYEASKIKSKDSLREHIIQYYIIEKRLHHPNRKIESTYKEVDNIKQELDRISNEVEKLNEKEHSKEEEIESIINKITLD